MLENAAGRGYQISAELGRGGMGVVHGCQQAVFARTVAAKTIIPERLTDRSRGVFLAEAAIVAHLAHPNIIPVHDLLQHPQQGPILVMKQVHGHEWTDLLRSGIAPTPVEDPRHDLRRTLDQHLDILLDVCDAMTFAHSRGILHRDLKPQNIMIGQHGEVLVMDWGCAVCYHDQAPHPLIPLTSQLRGISGTPGYLAPEMAQAEHHLLGPASDVYLLGGILYAILTGRPPHRGGDSASSGGSSNAVQAVLASAALGVVPELQVVHDGQRPCPPGLARFAMQALEPDIARRLPSAQALADGIKAWRRHDEGRQYLRQAATLLGRMDHTAPEDRLDLSLQVQAAIAAANHACPDIPAARPLSLRSRLAQARALLDQGAADQAATMATQLQRHAKQLRLQDVHAEVAALRDDAQVLLDERRRQQRLRTMAKYGGTGFVLIAVIIMAVAVTWLWREAAATEQAMDDLRRSRQEAETAAEQAALAQAGLSDLEATLTSERTEGQTTLGAIRTQIADKEAVVAEQRTVVATAQDAVRQRQNLASGNLEALDQDQRQMLHRLNDWAPLNRLYAWSQDPSPQRWTAAVQASWDTLSASWPADHAFIRRISLLHHLSPLEDVTTEPDDAAEALAELATIIDGDTPYLIRWQAKLDMVTDVRQRITPLLEDPQAIEDNDRLLRTLEREVGPQDPMLRQARRVISDAAAQAQARIDRIANLRSSLASLDQAQAITDQQRQELDVLQDLVGDQDPDVRRWRNKIRTVDRLRKQIADALESGDRDQLLRARQAMATLQGLLGTEAFDAEELDIALLRASIPAALKAGGQQNIEAARTMLERLEELVGRDDPVVRAGIPRFIDHDNGTVTDTRTGLLWLKNANQFGTMNWTHAIQAPKQLQHGRFGLSDNSQPGDWRLPSSAEYLGLHRGVRIPEGHPFINVRRIYWTSQRPSHMEGWAAYHSIGNNIVNPYQRQSELYHVWAVRDNP